MYAFNMSDASRSWRCLVTTLSAYLKKTLIDAAIREVVPRLQYSRATEKPTSVIREFVDGRRVGVFANGRWQVALPYCSSLYIWHFGRTGWLFLHRSCQQRCSLPSPFSDGWPCEYPTRRLMLSDFPLTVGKTTNASLPVTNALIALVCFSKTTKMSPSHELSDSAGLLLYRLCNVVACSYSTASLWGSGNTTNSQLVATWRLHDRIHGRSLLRFQRDVGYL